MASRKGAAFNPQENEGASEKSDAEPVLIFQCGSCYRILGDSVSWISSNAEMKTISLSGVTSTVFVGKSIKIADSGPDAGSTYALLRCSGCKTDIGKIYKSTVRGLDDMRGLYTLNVEALQSYQLSSPVDDLAIEEHSKYSWNSQELKEQLIKLQGLCVHLTQRIELCENHLGIPSAELDDLEM